MAQPNFALKEIAKGKSVKSRYFKCMSNVENIYLNKLAKFQSVLATKAAKIGGASGEFSDILSDVEQRMGLESLQTDLAPDAYSPYTGGSKLAVSASTEEIDAAVRQAAIKTGLDPALIKAVIQVESSFRTNAESGCGAQGLMQLMPGTAKSLGVTNSFDAYQNVMGGSTYLMQQLNRFGDVRLALAAYNKGPGRIGRLDITNANDPAQYSKISEGVRGYVDKVLKYYNQFAAV